MHRNDRVDLLYLNDSSAKFRPLMNLAPRFPVDPSSSVSGGTTYHGIPRATASPTFPERSSVGSSSWRSDDSSVRRRPSASTIDSEPPSIHNTPPWVDSPMTALDYTYTLPCEFAVMHRCGVQFHPEAFRNWISHCASHFVGSTPPKAVCIFCDIPPFEDWEKRMLHMGAHYHNGATLEGVRPDFFVIEHLHRNNVSTDAEFEWYKLYSERPYCDGLVEENFKSPEMQARERRANEAILQRRDLEHEDRQIRRDKGKRTVGRPHRQVHKSRISQELRS